jgi:hypothetical protein
MALNYLNVIISEEMRQLEGLRAREPEVSGSNDHVTPRAAVNS